MSNFLLTWNRSKRLTSYDGILEMVLEARSQGYSRRHWNVYATARAKPGDRAYLLRQGKRPNNIFGYGTILESPAIRKTRWLNEESPQSLVQFDLVSDPEFAPPLVNESQLRDFLLASGLEPASFLNVRASGLISLPDEVAKRVDELIQMKMHFSGERQTYISSPTSGPTPTSWTKEVSYVAEEPAFKYVMRFGNRSIWKIGHAKSLEQRITEINLHIPSEVINEIWQNTHKQAWPTQQLAFEMEQAVLKNLVALRTVGERVQCSKEVLERAWIEAYSSVRRR